LREGNRLRAFENRLLRNSLGFKGDDGAGDRRRVHHDELYRLYSSPNIIRVMKSRRIRWTGCLARMGDRGGAYRISAGVPDSRRPLRRPGRRWEYNIIIYLISIIRDFVVWISVAQNTYNWQALVDAVMNFGVQ
jgi:hypothetical protein